VRSSERRLANATIGSNTGGRRQQRVVDRDRDRHRQVLREKLADPMLVCPRPNIEPFGGFLVEAIDTDRHIQ
jgi:hypothetical protein